MSDDYMTNLERQQFLAEEIRKLKAEEMELRRALFEGTFPNPTEGTNNYELPDGRVVKGTFKLNRSVNDHDEIAGLPKAHRDQFFRQKFELSISAYKAADEETREWLDQFITVKPGSPELRVKPAPK